MNEFRAALLRDMRAKSIPAPEVVVDDARARTFDDMIEDAVARGPGSAIEFRAPYPKHEFLWHAGRRGLVLHGSNNTRITVFEPRFQADALGRPLEGVFGTTDWVLPIFYAILKRKSYRGSIRFALFRGSESEPRYFMSVNQDVLRRGAWTNGAVYLLPGESFEKTLSSSTESLDEFGLDDEFERVSRVHVRPVARLDVTPTDFPLLDRIEAHDDTSAIRYRELQLRLIRHVTRVDTTGDGFRVVFRPRDGVAADLAELVGILEELLELPGTTMSVSSDAEGPGLDVSGEGAEPLARSLRSAVRTLRVVRRIPGALRLAPFLLRRPG